MPYCDSIDYIWLDHSFLVLTMPYCDSIKYIWLDHSFLVLTTYGRTCSNTSHPRLHQHCSIHHKTKTENHYPSPLTSEILEKGVSAGVSSCLSSIDTNKSLVDKSDLTNLWLLFHLDRCHHGLRMRALHWLTPWAFALHEPKCGHLWLSWCLGWGT